jgi:hypothetical protein
VLYEGVQLVKEGDAITPILKNHNDIIKTTNQ